MKTASQKQSVAAANETPGQIRENYWAEALRISELRYRRLFETAQDGILILDADSGRGLETTTTNSMEHTITQNGALYAIQHPASHHYRRVLRERPIADKQIHAGPAGPGKAAAQQVKTEEPCFISSGT